MSHSIFSKVQETSNTYEHLSAYRLSRFQASNLEGGIQKENEKIKAFTN